VWTRTGSQYARRRVSEHRAGEKVRFEVNEVKEEGPKDEPNKAKEELHIWSLNVRSIATESKLKELEQEAERSKNGILLLQETWRKETAEQIKIGNWTFYGTGNAVKPKGNGTGVLVHNSIPIESWHYISSRITAVRIRHGEKHIMILSAYAPTQGAGACSARTNQFYEQLTAKVKEAKARGDIVIIGGDMNASIKEGNAPGLVGKWASNKMGTNSEGLINFMMEHEMAALNTFQQTQWRKRYTWSRGTTQTMIDFFLGPVQMRREALGGKDRQVAWNMNSDHRVIQMTLAGNQHKKNKDGRRPKKGR
jgi:exonuclease III